jgi:NarL family two-component system response regulator LiaR
MALLFIALKFLEYQFFARHLRWEIYLGILALLFTTLGLWMGRQLAGRKPPSLANTETREEETKPPPQEVMSRLGISPREYEVLRLIAKGCSNEEIARTLFISIPTVKSHSYRLFAKLDVKRRTQAVSKAKELRLLA